MREVDFWFEKEDDMLLQHKLFLLMFFFFLLLSRIGHNRHCQDQYFFFDCFLEDHLSLLSFWSNVSNLTLMHTKAIRKIRCASLNFKFLSWIRWDEVDSRTIMFKYLGRLDKLLWDHLYSVGFWNTIFIILLKSRIIKKLEEEIFWWLSYWFILKE